MKVPNVLQVEAQACLLGMLWAINNSFDSVMVYSTLIYLGSASTRDIRIFKV